jgi:hypothetical protein
MISVETNTLLTEAEVSTSLVASTPLSQFHPRAILKTYFTKICLHGLPNRYFRRGSPTKILHTFLVTPIQSTYSASRILLNLAVLTMLCKVNISRCSLQCKGKVKVVPVLFLTEHHVMKKYWASGGIAPRILSFGTRWR